MKVRFSIVSLVLVIFLLTACQSSAPSATETANSQLPNTPQVTQPTLEAGKGGVTGSVISKITGEPLDNTSIRLAEVVRQDDQAAFVLDAAFSPGTTSDENGNFMISNVEAKEYVLVVGNVEIYQGYEIIQDSTGQANTYEIKPDEFLDLGVIEVNITGDEY